MSAQQECFFLPKIFKAKSNESRYQKYTEEKITLQEKNNPKTKTKNVKVKEHRSSLNYNSMSSSPHYKRCCRLTSQTKHQREKNNKFRSISYVDKQKCSRFLSAKQSTQASQVYHKGFRSSILDENKSQTIRRELSFNQKNHSKVKNENKNKKIKTQLSQLRNPNHFYDKLGQNSAKTAEGADILVKLSQNIEAVKEIKLYIRRRKMRVPKVIQRILENHEQEII